jgi:hypothetical protein
VSELALAASSATLDLSAAELHGAVCGIQCAAARRHLMAMQEPADEDETGESPHDGILPLDDFLALVGTEAVRDTDALIAFAHLAAEDLFADDFRFSPLLPADDEPIGERVEALAEWCSAFLAGFSALGDTGISEGEAEIIEDLSAISCAEKDQDDDDEEAERSYAEIVGYLKVTVLTLLHPEGEMAQ